MDLERIAERRMKNHWEPDWDAPHWQNHVTLPTGATCENCKYCCMNVCALGFALRGVVKVVIPGDRCRGWRRA